MELPRTWEVLLLHTNKLDGQEKDVTVRTSPTKAPKQPSCSNSLCLGPERQCKALWSRISHSVGDRSSWES